MNEASDASPKGTSLRQAKGASPGSNNRPGWVFRANGPTIRLEGERMARWAERDPRATEVWGRLRHQGCALRWANGWAFGPRSTGA